MLDAEGHAAGICFMGPPPDQDEKTSIGALDIRRFPFLS